MTSEIIMYAFSVTSTNIAINDISLKTRFSGLHFCRTQYRSIINHFDVIGPKTAKFGEIRAITPFKVIQGRRFLCQLNAYMGFPVNDKY